MPSPFSRDIENLIAQFRGMPENLSRSTLRDSKGIESLIDSCVKSYKIGEEHHTDQIMANWKDIVGIKNAHRCCPKTLSRGNLIVAVANSVVRNELQFKSREIINKIQALRGCESILGITFVAG